MVETGAITQAQADAAKANPAVIADRAGDGRAQFLFRHRRRRGAKRATHRRRGAERRSRRAHDAGAAIQDAARAAASLQIIARAGRKVHAQRGGRRGDEAGRRGGRRWSAAPTTTRAPSTARPRRIASPAPRSSRSSIWRRSKAGLTPWDMRDDEPVDIDGWTPTNFGGRSYGTLTLADALAHSVNTITANLAQEVGVSASWCRRRSAAASPRRSTQNASLALGTSEVTPLELTTRLCGVRQRRHRRSIPISSPRSTDAGGRVLYQRKPPETANASSPSHVNQRSRRDALRRGDRRAPAAAPPFPATRPAGKTGTTQDYPRRLVRRLHRRLCDGVWVGNDDSSPMKSVTGGSLPATIWHATMTVAEKGLPSTPLDKSDAAGAGRGHERIRHRPHRSAGDKSSDDESGGATTSAPGEQREQIPQASNRNFFDWLFGRKNETPPPPPPPPPSSQSGDSNGDNDSN